MVTVQRTRVVDRISPGPDGSYGEGERTTYKEIDVFVDDAVAQAPTWLLVSTLWHFFPATGISLCGYVASSMGLYARATPAQHYRNHTARKLHERTITRLCPKCERAHR